MTRSKKTLTVIDQINASDKVRKKIIEAASTLYVQKGFTATSIEEISEKAGVSLPVTYHYVKKKSEIMKMIYAFQENLIKEIKGVDDPEEKLAIAVVLYFKVMDGQGEKVLLMYQKSSSLDKASKSKVMQLEVQVSQIFSGIIEEGIQSGIFNAVDVDLMAYNIILMAHMWVLKRWHFKKRLSFDNYIDQQLAIILNALKL